MYVFYIYIVRRSITLDDYRYTSAQRERIAIKY